MRKTIPLPPQRPQFTIETELTQIVTQYVHNIAALVAENKNLKLRVQTLEMEREAQKGEVPTPEGATEEKLQ